MSALNQPQIVQYDTTKTGHSGLSTAHVTHAYPLYSVIARSTAAHGELVELRGNLDEVERTSANRRRYGDAIANPRIEYGAAMTSFAIFSRRYI